MRALLFFLFAQIMSAQILHHQSFSSQGNSTVTAKGFFVSQTIGQQSISGTFKGSGYTIQQGFQQSVFAQNSTTANSLTVTTTKVYPNPFDTTVNFEFTTEIKTEIQVDFYDSSGRLVYSTRQMPEQNILTINSLGDLQEGHYFVSLKADNFKYGTQLIKLKTL